MNSVNCSAVSELVHVFLLHLCNFSSLSSLRAHLNKTFMQNNHANNWKDLKVLNCNCLPTYQEQSKIPLHMKRNTLLYQVLDWWTNSQILAHSSIKICASYDHPGHLWPAHVPFSSNWCLDLRSQYKSLDCLIYKWPGLFSFFFRS